MMVTEEKNGFDSVPDMQEALARIEARLTGVTSDWDFEHISWWNDLKV
jgi:hypothetical protein